MSQTTDSSLELSIDGLRYTPADFQILKDLSTFNVDAFLAKRHSNSAEILGKMVKMAISLLGNPRIDATEILARNTRLEAELENERANVTAFRSLQVAPPPAIGRATAPDPELFDGNRDKLKSFISHLSIKLRNDAHQYPTPQHQLGYAVGFLRGPAFTQIEPLVKVDRIDLPDVAALVRILENAFGDPDREATAEKKIKNIKQGNREFSVYYAEFQRYAADLDWNEKAKKSALTDGLCDEIQTLLLSADQPPKDLNEYAMFLQRMDNRIRLHKAKKGGQRTTTTTTTTSRATTSTATSSSRPRPNSPEPMDLSAGAGKRRITAEERQKRMQEGRCLYCGGLGHLVRQCPSTKTLQGNEATVTTASPAPTPPPTASVASAPKPAEN